jgi:hypothetical protein
LAVALFGAESIFRMEVAYDRQRVGHRPFDRAPIPRNQRVRSQLLQDAAEMQHVPERVALANGEVGVADIDLGGEAFAALEIAVHGDDGMAPRLGITVGNGGEAHLRTADGERREDVQKQGALISHGEPKGKRSTAPAAVNHSP